MILTDKMRTLVKRTTIVISIHTVLLVVYSYAHAKIDLLYAMTEYTPVLLLLCLTPLVAVFFLSTPSARQGAIFLLGILPAELVYNIVVRFIVESPMIEKKQILIWKIMYEVSFGLVLFFEVIGFLMTLKLLQEIHKQMSHPIDNLPAE